MRRTSLNDVYRIPDIQSRDRFNFTVGTTPNLGTDRNLHIKCQNIAIPGYSNEPVTTTIFGHERKDRGRLVEPRQIAVVYYEDENFSSSNAVRRWHNAVVNGRTAFGTNKNQYAINTEIKTYDSQGRDNYIVSFVNMFPQNVEQIDLSVDSSTAMTISATFSYDYIHEVGGGQNFDIAGALMNAANAAIGGFGGISLGFNLGPIGANLNVSGGGVSGNVTSPFGGGGFRF